MPDTALTHNIVAICSMFASSSLLEYSNDEQKIRSQDFFTLISYLGSNAVASRHVWDWVRANYDSLIDR